MRWRRARWALVAVVLVMSVGAQAALDGHARDMLADLAPGGGLWMVLPGGQSGIPASPHHADLAPLWATFRDVPLCISAAERDVSAEILVLDLPARAGRAP